MTLNELRHLIEPEWDMLRARGVTALYVFGSVARDQATAASDVDILVDYDPTSDFNLFDLAGVQRRLAARLGVNVDVVTRDGVHRRIRERVLQQAVRVM